MDHISPVPVVLRDRVTVESWFADLGLDLVELHGWRPEPDDPPCTDALPLATIS